LKEIGKKIIVWAKIKGKDELYSRMLQAWLRCSWVSS